MITNDGSPARSPATSPDPDSPLALPRVRSPEKAAATRPASEFGLPFRRPNSSLSAFFDSNSAASLSKRASSPIVGFPWRHERRGSAFPAQAPFGGEDANEYKNLIVRSFSPHVAILSSPDAEELLAQKGLNGGLLSLLRPYGENVQGKVTIRDSSGSSSSCEDYAVHFTKLKDGLQNPRVPEQPDEPNIQNITGYLDKQFPHLSARLRTGGDIQYVEDVIEKHLQYSEPASGSGGGRRLSTTDRPELPSPYESPFHLLYLRRLLSGIPLSPHETLSHPVACVIAISSRSPDPIEELRQLYASTRNGSETLPPWVNGEYLRYYVLIHDEEHDDAQRSTMLFEQMKRHFGLHCHLLRLRSTQCVPSDDDCVRLPTCEWLSAAEELSEIQRRESMDELDDENVGPYIYESDSVAIRAMVRELVTQSIIPTMERLSTTWNDQIVSRRRGLSGRFLSLSKKWTPFGSSNRNSSLPFGGSSNSSSNYDPVQGIYLPDTPEAIMRKLADYAFMLRDFKLAQGTYDLIRQDYTNDKAWKYHAGATEMSVITSLITGQGQTKSRGAETLDQMMESAVYSYTTRCNAPFSALRALAVATELMHLRGGAGADDAARWGQRVLDLDLVGRTGGALVCERVASCYASRKGTGSHAWGSRRRKAALWNLLATRAWLNMDRSAQAEACLAQVVALYRLNAKDAGSLGIESMRELIADLREVVQARTGLEVPIPAELEGEAQDVVEPIEETSEKVDVRSGRKSLDPLAGTAAVAIDKPDFKKHRRSMSRVSLSTSPNSNVDPLGVGPMAENAARISHDRSRSRGQ